MSAEGKYFGGSLLPSGDRSTYQVKSGDHGTFETRKLLELNTHGLFYAKASGPFTEQPCLIAAHPNGYSCDELAKRILAAWEGGSNERALAQFDYIMDCGGMGKRRTYIEMIVTGAANG